MRIRSIKPEFWRSEDITSLADWRVRLLFLGLWSYVDDNGVGVDDFRRITADLFALEDDQTAVREVVREGLAILAVPPREGSQPLITRYQIDGRGYLYITGWAHQRVDKPNKARYPYPDGTIAHVYKADPAAPATRCDRDSRESRESLAPGAEEQGNRGTAEQGSRTGKSAAAASPSVPAPREQQQQKIDQLREELRSRQIIVSWAHLRIEVRNTICRLIDAHGVCRLADTAARVYKPSNPANHVGAFMGAWQELPAPRSGRLRFCPVHPDEFLPCEVCAERDGAR